MEKIIHFASQDQHSVFSIDLVDVGGGPARLYIWNGGMWTPDPSIGDFLYDFQTHTFLIFQSSGWNKVSMAEVISRVKHPGGKSSVASFTQSALPYWMPSGTNLDPLKVKFNTVYETLQHFKAFDSKMVQVHTYSNSLKRNIGGEEAEGQVEEYEPPRPKRIRENSPKDPSRFTNSFVGFPEGRERIRWQGGFETFRPFAGSKRKRDLEGLLVRELSLSQSLEQSHSELPVSPSSSFQVQDLVVELELDSILQDQNNHEYDEVERSWIKFISKIRSYMAESISVVIRGWTPTMRLRFSKESLKIHFGDLGQPCQWLDGIRFAAYKDSFGDHNLEYHEVTTLGTFLDLVKDPNKCGNFLDAKDVNASPPLWVKPLLDSATAWNHTMHLRITQKPKGKKGKKPGFTVETHTQTVVRSSTWTSQGWRLVTHPGFVTFPHHDCCGMATYVIGDCGAKIWGIIRPKLEACSSSLNNLTGIFREATTQDEEGRFANADIATVCLEEGDIMFQPPGVLHAVYTPVPAVFRGGYFYNYETMHLTRAVLSLNTIEEEESLTNDDRPGFLRTLGRMLLALRYRSEPREIGKKSLLSLILIVVEHEKVQKGKEKSNEPCILTKEEGGEWAFAKETAESILKWMKITVEEAREYVEKQGPYYSGGCERVKIPALKEGEKDPIFPILL